MFAHKVSPVCRYNVKCANKLHQSRHRKTNSSEEDNKRTGEKRSGKKREHEPVEEEPTEKVSECKDDSDVPVPVTTVA